MSQILEAKYVPEGAKLFEGRYVDVMPEILRAGLAPISPAQAMDLRNKHVTADENGPWRTLLDTDAGIAVDGNRVYLFPHSRTLRELTSETELTRYGVKLTNTKGSKSFSRKELVLDLNRDLTEKRALAHPIWLALAEGDEERLGNYVQNAFKLRRDTYKFESNRGMAFHVLGEYQPILRAVVLKGMGKWQQNDATGSLDLLRYGSLVGLRGVEAPLEQKLAA